MRIKQSARRFLGGEPWSADGGWDVVVVGLPSDVGSRAPSLARNGPAKLRRVTAALAPVGRNRAEGWYDFAARRSILAGLRLADFGDLVLDPLDVGNDLKQIPAVLRELRQSCRLLVVLGGDDSLSYWSCRDAGLRRLVHLDAHEDAAAPTGEYPHHGNFISHLERDEPELAILQYGQRDLVPGPPRQPGRNRVACASLDVLCETLDALAAREGGYTALCVDIDVLDPHIMPSVTNPLPDGLGLGELTTVIEAAAAHGRPVRQFMLTEFAPVADTAGTADAATAAHLLMRSIDACLR